MSTQNTILITVAVAVVIFILWSGSKNNTPTILGEVETVVNTENIKENNLEANSNESMTTVTMTTNMGAITLELYDTLAPNTVQNFKTLAEKGFYDGTRFHRVIKGFMIQGGDPLSKDVANQPRWGTGGPTGEGYPFADEIHAENNNNIGTIAMANSGPNTNGSQFFINTANNNFLDTKHTVFGKVTAGADVVAAIENNKTGEQDRPIEDMIIEKIEVK